MERVKFSAVQDKVKLPIVSTAEIGAVRCSDDVEAVGDCIAWVDGDLAAIRTIDKSSLVHAARHAPIMELEFVVARVRSMRNLRNGVVRL